MEKAESKKALSEVCDGIYKRDKDAVDPHRSDEGKQKLTADLFKYCSLLWVLPETMESKTLDNPQLSSDAKKLADSRLNDKFWTIKERWFSELETGGNEDYFKARVGRGFGKKKLRRVCREAYQAKTADGAKGPKRDDIIKYCSFDTAGVNPK